jgi:hypothetical protein
MTPVIEAILTFLANVGGYALAAFVVIHFIRKAGSGWRGLPDAAVALFLLWMLTMAVYVGLEFWVDTYGSVNRVPPWLDASDGIAENIQSEVFQVWLASMVFKWLKWPGSPESK